MDRPALPARSGWPRCAAFLLWAASGCMPPSWGAGALLHPGRKAVTEAPAVPHRAVTIQGEGVTLEGWLFPAVGARRGTIVYLHGSASNRTAGTGIARRYVARGYDVLTYDSRAHGNSSGDACTYGFYEKRDLSRAIDWLQADRVAVIGSSLGAAVALQAAAADSRVMAVVAVATFSDLRSVARERAPFFASRRNVEQAFAIAERDGRFRIDEASPLAAAPRVRAPVLLLHGDADRDTPIGHSERVLAALVARKRLIRLPGRGHNDALDEAAWQAIDRWLEEAGRERGTH